MKLIFKIKIIAFLTVMLLFIGCNNEWKIVRTFNSLKGVASHNELKDVQIGFLNDKIGFAINRGNNVYYSADGGEKWEGHHVNTNPCLSGFDIIDENNMVIGCECSFVEYSSDKGKTWTKTEESSYPMLSFFNNNSGLIVQSYNIKLLENFKTVDDIYIPAEYKGAFMAGIAATACISNNEFYFLLSGKGPLLKTADGGKTWEKINLDKIKDKLFFQKDITSMRFTDSNNGTIITYHNKNKAWIVLNTKDGGKTWKYSTLLKTNIGCRSYLSKDAKYVTIVNMNEKKYPLVFLKKEI